MSGREGGCSRMWAEVQDGWWLHFSFAQDLWNDGLWDPSKEAIFKARGSTVSVLW